MLDIDETIDIFRRSALDIDCKRMVLTQRNVGGERFEGQGYIRQADDGMLILKIYVEKHNAKPFGHVEAVLGARAGKLYPDATFYDLDATGHDNTRWTAEKIRLVPQWDMADMTVLAGGQMQSMIAHLAMPQKQHHLVLHFFDEYRLPLDRMSETEKNGNRYFTRDRAEFDACGAKFAVRVREGSGDTVFEVASETAFPIAFDLRVQEALQYITAKTAFWRARVQTVGEELHLELASPWRKTARTQFSPPISPASINFHKHGWELFEKYLSHVTEKTQGTHWNPMAYHLYNACEATGSSMDAWAAGISIAVEALISLVNLDKQKDDRLTLFQERALKWLAEQHDLADVAKRAKGQIGGMSRQSPRDKLYALAEMGHVEKSYVKVWGDLRNRHVHPTLKDLEKPGLIDYQFLLDQIHQVETLLRQLTFYLIGYEGPFTDYGVHGMHDFPSKQYPLPASTA